MNDGLRFANPSYGVDPPYRVTELIRLTGLEDMREAVKLTAGRAKLKLEASGDIKDSTLRVTVFVIPR